MLHRVEVEMSAVIIAVTDEVPRLVSVRSSSYDARRESAKLDVLPFGPLNATGDDTLELATRRWVRDASGLELGYVEQLYTFGDRFRHPARLTDEHPLPVFDGGGGHRQSWQQAAKRRAL